MKRTTTKMEITVQTRRRITIRGRRPAATWCEQCGAEVSMLTPADAAALAGTSARDIFRRVEAGELHFLETDEGALRVCVNSLGGTTSGSDFVQRVITGLKPRCE